MFLTTVLKTHPDAAYLVVETGHDDEDLRVIYAGPSPTDATDIARRGRALLLRAKLIADHTAPEQAS